MDFQRGHYLQTEPAGGGLNKPASRPPPGPGEDPARPDQDRPRERAAGAAQQTFSSGGRSAGTKRHLPGARAPREPAPRRGSPRPRLRRPPDPLPPLPGRSAPAGPARAPPPQPRRSPQPELSPAGRHSQRGASFISPHRGVGEPGGRAPAPGPATGKRGSSGRGPRGRRLLWVSVKEIMAAGVPAGVRTAPREARGGKQRRESEAGKQPKRQPPRLPETRSHPRPSSGAASDWLNPLPRSTNDVESCSVTRGRPHPPTNERRVSLAIGGAGRPGRVGAGGGSAETAGRRELLAGERAQVLRSGR